MGVERASDMPKLHTDSPPPPVRVSGCPCLQCVPSLHCWLLPPGHGTAGRARGSLWTALRPPPSEPAATVSASWEPERWTGAPALRLGPRPLPQLDLEPWASVSPAVKWLTALPGLIHSLDLESEEPDLKQ